MTPEETTERTISGDIAVAARLMRAIDDGDPQAVEVLKLLYPHTGRAQVVGITGSPGVGKSTLTNEIISLYRRQNMTVGVVAVDPTSPFSGGAIMGDRIRMQRQALDEGVFIRSLATRGQFGGLTSSTRGVVAVLDAMGKDVIIVETVGVGQDEVDIASMADTTIIVTVPGMGDDVQAIKAGILEVGDIFVVNKADRTGASRTVSQLKAMLAFSFGYCSMEEKETWYPPVIETCCLDGKGIESLVGAVGQHRQALLANGGQLLANRRVNRAQKEIRDLFQHLITRMLLERLGDGSQIAEMAKAIADKKTDPYTACEQLMQLAGLK